MSETTTRDLHSRAWGFVTTLAGVSGTAYLGWRYLAGFAVCYLLALYAETRIR